MAVAAPYWVPRDASPTVCPATYRQIFHGNNWQFLPMMREGGETEREREGEGEKPGESVGEREREREETLSHIIEYSYLTHC